MLRMIKKNTKNSLVFYVKTLRDSFEHGKDEYCSLRECAAFIVEEHHSLDAPTIFSDRTGGFRLCRLTG